MQVNNTLNATGPLAQKGRTSWPASFADQKRYQSRTSSAKTPMKTNGSSLVRYWSGLVQGYQMVLVRSGGVSTDTPDGPPEPAGQILNRMEGAT